MPFGLMNALATFIRLMDDIFWPFTNSFVVLYLDHILVFNKELGRTLATHSTGPRHYVAT
jgi:hypothetical protein